MLYEVFAEKPFPKWRHQELVDAWPSRIDARGQYTFLVYNWFFTRRIKYLIFIIIATL